MMCAPLTAQLDGSKTPYERVMAARLDASQSDDLRAIAGEVAARQRERPPEVEPPQPCPRALCRLTSRPPGWSVLSPAASVAAAGMYCCPGKAFLLW